MGHILLSCYKFQWQGLECHCQKEHVYCESHWLETLLYAASQPAQLEAQDHWASEWGSADGSDPVDRCVQRSAPCTIHTHISAHTLTEFNPNLGDVTRATRVAYVKFMRKKMAADEVSVGEGEEAPNGDTEKKPDANGVIITELMTSIDQKLL